MGRIILFVRDGCERSSHMRQSVEDVLGQPPVTINVALHPQLPLQMAQLCHGAKSVPQVPHFKID